MISVWAVLNIGGVSVGLRRRLVGREGGGTVLSNRPKVGHW